MPAPTTSGLTVSQQQLLRYTQNVRRIVKDTKKNITSVIEGNDAKKADLARQNIQQL